MNFIGQSLRTGLSVVSFTANNIWCQQTRLATKKAGGSSRNGRDSAGRRLGVKKFGGEVVQCGSIIIRQRGTKYRPGVDVGLGRDHTIYSMKSGYVKFTWDVVRKQQIVNVSPINPNPPPKPKPIYEMSLGAMLKKREADRKALRRLKKEKKTDAGLSKISATVTSSSS
jgi:large subunit ribosomal protein L27